MMARIWQVSAAAALTRLGPVTALTCLILAGGWGVPFPEPSALALPLPAQGVVFTQPGAGDGPVLEAVHRARSTVWVEAYVLTHRKLVLALGEAVRRGVRVRVLLEQHPYGEGGPLGPSPQVTYQALHRVGAEVRWTSPAFTVTHSKAILIDDTTAIISTANFTPKGFAVNNGKQREFGIIDTRPAVVDALLKVFVADWFRTRLTLADTSLVVSPLNARTAVLDMINTARRSLCIDNEQVSDTGVQAALYAAHLRGVSVRIVLPMRDRRSSLAGLHLTTPGGIAVRVTITVNMHAKLIVADGRRAFVGSQNLADTALDKNREIGVVVDDPGMVDVLARTFEHDWAGATLRLRLPA